MATIGDILIDLRAGTARFRRDLLAAKRMTKDTTSKMAKSFRSVTSAAFSVKGAVVAIGGGALARSFVKAADTAEGFSVRLNTLLGSAEEGNKLFQDMATFAGRVPFEYEQIMSSATALSGVMKGGRDEINEWMPMIGDLAAVTGLSIEDTTSQVIRMYSAGAASADMFRERGVLSMLGFQAGVSYSAEETRKIMMEQWKSADSQFRGATDGLAKTWSGLTSMMADKWFAFRTETMNSGVFDFLKEGLRQINAFLDDAFESGQVKAWAKDLSDYATKGIKGLIVGVGWLVDGFNGLKMLWQVLKIGFLSFSEQVWKGLLKVREATTDILKEIYIQTGKMGDAWEESAARGEGFKDNIKLIRDEINRSKEGLEEYAGGYEYMSDKAKAWVNQVEESSKRVVQAQEDVRKGSTGAKQDLQELERLRKEAAKREKELLNAAKRWYEETRTPQEEYNQKIDELAILVSKGKISWDTWARSVSQAEDELKSLETKGESFSENFNNAVTGWASNFSSDLNDMLWESDRTFEDILKSFMKMITQMIIQVAIVKPMLTSFGFTFADGGVFKNGAVTAFAGGGVVTGPTFFPMKGGVGLMGEAGEEAIMPLERDAKGRLGVSVTDMAGLGGGGGGAVIVNVHNYGDSGVEVRESEGSNGAKQIDIIIDDIMADKLLSGKSAKALRNGYGLSAQTARR